MPIVSLSKPLAYARLADLLGQSGLNLIDGQWRPALCGASLRLENPADPGELIARVPDSAQADLDAAIEAARAAAPAWVRTPAPARARILLDAAAKLRFEVEGLAATLSWEEGKPLFEARVEVARALNALEFLAGEGRRLGGDTRPSDLPGVMAYSTRKPLGVVGLITPWNFPIAIPAWKMAPALVSGNVVVLKPAELSPLCAALLAHAFMEAGLPPGVLNLIQGGPESGKALVADARVAAISFTGSTAVGREINQVAARRMAKVQLELGGKNAAIVLPDVDLDATARDLAGAIWGSTGQRCTATSRVLAHRDIASELTERLVALAQEVKVGPGLDPETTMGPLIEASAVEKSERYVKLAQEQGAVLRCGGERLNHLAPGHFFAATVLSGVRADHAIAREEVFGPVVAIMEIDSLEAAVSLSNQVPYGLSSALYTRDLEAAFRYAATADTGLLHVNCSTIYSEVHLPFGGTKASGFGGREMGPHALDFYTEWQTMFLRPSL